MFPASRGAHPALKLLAVAGAAMLLLPLARAALQEHQLGTQLDAALAAAGPVLQRFDTGGHRLQVPAIGEVIREHDVLRVLRADDRRHGYFTLDLFNQPQATAAAMGLDRRHHVVNAYLVGYSPFRPENIWTPLFLLASRKAYQFDHLQYPGEPDLWQTSRQALLLTRGDCEDHALALADWLIDLGEDARVVVGKYRDEGHAWVVLFKDGQVFLLEATDKGVGMAPDYPLAYLETDYRPWAMFNRNSFWSNTGTERTTDYSSAAWQITSRYSRDRLSDPRLAMAYPRHVLSRNRAMLQGGGAGGRGWALLQDEAGRPLRLEHSRDAQVFRSWLMVLPSSEPDVAATLYSAMRAVGGWSPEPAGRPPVRSEPLDADWQLVWASAADGPLPQAARFVPWSP